MNIKSHVFEAIFGVLVCFTPEKVRDLLILVSLQLDKVFPHFGTLFCVHKDRGFEIIVRTVQPRMI